MNHHSPTFRYKVTMSFTVSFDAEGALEEWFQEHCDVDPDGFPTGDELAQWWTSRAEPAELLEDAVPTVDFRAVAGDSAMAWVDARRAEWIASRNDDVPRNPGPIPGDVNLFAGQVVA